MNMTAILFLGTCLTVSAAGLAQNINISVKNAPLEKVFDEIKRQTTYTFVYYKDDLKNAKKITLQVSNISVDEVLQLVFKDQPVTYTIVDKVVIIKQKSLIADLSLRNSSSSGTNTSPPVTGIVKGPDGQPLAGVNVMVKGTKRGTTSDKDGRFSIDAEEGSVLEVSSIGFGKKEIRIFGSNELMIALEIASSILDEVQYIAYGQTSQRFNVGNVGTVKAADIEMQPVQNPLLALQGRIPGLFITQTNGLPGGGVTVRIQGRNSIVYGNDPLYVVDGVPFFSQLPSTEVDAVLGSSGGVAGMNANGNPLSYINTSDIESVSVLKDADATAIYGSRAANGAILITTKKGKAGKMKIDITGQTGWGVVANKWDMLNSRQYLDMRYEALKNDQIDLSAQSETDASYYDLLVWDTTRFTDWQETLLGGTARYNNFSASVSGGSNNMQYLISGTYRKETSVFPGTFADEKASFHFSTSGTSDNQKLKFQFSGSYMLDKNQLPTRDFTEFARTEPVAPEIYNEDGTLNWALNAAGTSTWYNPFAELLREYKNRSGNLMGNLDVAYEILPGFKVRTSLGYTNFRTEDYSPIPLTYYSPDERPTSVRSAQYGSRNLSSWIVEPQLMYNRAFGQSTIDVLVGGTIQRKISQTQTLYAEGFNSDEDLENLSAANDIRSGGQFYADYKYAATFGRINYKLRERYIVSLTARRDGTSRFGRENQFHNFGSIGGAWIFSQEEFMRSQHVVSFGKIRASYGTTGSDQIRDYAFMSLYYYWDPVAIPYQNSSTIFPGGLPNPYLQWEETRKLQAGIDLGFLKDRLMLGVTFARNRSSNQLLDYSLPSINGVNGIQRNFPALVQNISWEFSLNYTNIKSKFFNWQTSVNLTIPRNKLVEFPEIEKTPYANGFNGVVVGQPLGVMRFPVSRGVDPATGNYQFADTKGNIVLSPEFPTDYTDLVSTVPSMYGGIQNEMTYKGIEVNFLIQFVKQTALTQRKYNGTLFPGQFVRNQSNQPLSVLDRWQKPGDIATIGYYTTDYNGLQETRDDITDASYIRLKNVYVGYTLPQKLLGPLHSVNTKLFIQGQNLWTITRWKGLDPESQSFTSLPPLRMLTIGIQVEL